MSSNIFVAADTHSRKIEFESQSDDLFIMCGDWEQGEVNTKAKKILVSGNHDMFPTDIWDFVADGILLKHIWFTHEPAFTLPLGAYWNVHGHTHYHNPTELGYPKKVWHRALPPNQILLLEKFMFEENEKLTEDEKWR